jgi:ribonuclease HI
MAEHRQVLDGTYRLVVRQLLKLEANPKTSLVDLLWDLRKAFGNVSRSKLWAFGKQFNYPVDLLRVSISSYRWPRHLLMGNLISRPIGPGRGIGAGSAFATYELTLYLWSLVLAHTSLHPSVTLSIHVDDLSQSASGNNDAETASRLVASAKFVHAQLVDLGMPLADDKAQLVCTSGELAKFVHQGLGAIAGAHLDSVRRLGMDYSVSSRGRGKMTVRKNRFQKLKARMKIVKRLRKTAPAPLLFFAGVQPAVLFGIEFYQPHPKHITALTTAAAATLSSRPIGVPKHVCLLTVSASSHPRFKCISAPILRFAREVWVSTRMPEDLRPGDILTPQEVVGVWWAAKGMAPPFGKFPQGPIRALAAALCHIGWGFPAPTTMVTASGIVLDLTAGTPAMLNKNVLEDYKSLVDCQVSYHLKNREVVHENFDIDWFSIRKFLLHKAPTSRDKSCFLQYLCGTSLTPSWLHSHGWVIDHKCECGEINNVADWLAGCPARTANQQAHDLPPNKVQDTLAKQQVPIPSRAYGTPHCLVEGEKVDPSTFRWHPGHPIYTDGSCLFGNIGILAVASCAAVQLQPIRRTLQYALPACFPQSAVASEHVAVVVTVDKLAEGNQADIITDCQAVVNGVHHPDHVRLGHRNPMGGFWADIGAKVSSVTKVKAHLSKAQAEAAGESQHHHGNMVVDLLAKAALPCYNHCDISAFLRALEPKFKALCSLSHRLADVSGRINFKSLDRFKGARPAGSRPARTGHRYRWCGGLGRFVCMDCGKCLRNQPIVHDRACPGISKILAEAHLSHIMMRTRVVGSEAPLFFCSKCGCYTVSRSAGLTKPCTRTPYHSTIHNRLMSCLHPVSKRPLQQPSRVLPAALLGILDRSFDQGGHVAAAPPIAPGLHSVPSAVQPGPVGPADWQDHIQAWDLEDENSFEFDS